MCHRITLTFSSCMFSAAEIGLPVWQQCYTRSVTLTRTSSHDWYSYRYSSSWRYWAAWRHTSSTACRQVQPDRTGSGQIQATNQLWVQGWNWVSSTEQFNACWKLGWWCFVSSTLFFSSLIQSVYNSFKFYYSIFLWFSQSITLLNMITPSCLAQRTHIFF